MPEFESTLSITHVSYSMDIGGAERALFQLMRAQKDFGHSVRLIVVSKIGFYGSAAEKEGVEVIGLNLSFTRFIFRLQSLRKMFGDADVVHFHSPQPLLMSLSFFQQTPRYYFTLRGGRLKLPLKRRLSYAIARFFIRYFFSGVSGNTQFAAHCAEQRFGIAADAGFTTYNGIDFDLLQPRKAAAEIREEMGIPAGAIVIGTSANLKRWKRTEKLVQAVASLDGGIHLCIVGDGENRSDLESLADTLGLSKRCHFTGMQENVSDYLQTMDVFALPSDATESFGNSVVEAMGLGIPSVVMSDSPGIVEHMRFPGGLVAQDDNELAAILKKLVDNEQLRTEVGQRSCVYVREKYTYAQAVLAYNSLYQSMGFEAKGKSE